jgi:ubiquinone/menaquinone biosynthesis C-methylase UbiE
VTGVEGFYDQNAQYEWDRLDQHRTEFAVTMRALSDHLPPPPAKVLDVGGGPGRYAIALTRQGYEVTLVDLSRNCLDFARDKAGEAGIELAGYVHGDARNLAQFPPESCDVVLLMGPLYHLLRAAERGKAFREAGRVLKSGGLIFASFITRYTPIRYWAKHNPARIVEHRQRYEEFLATGVLKAPPEGAAFPDAHFAHPLEIRPLMEKAGFETLHLIACEGIVALMEEKINELGGECWEAWVEQNYRLGKDPAVHGAAEHLLYVGRKKSKHSAK